MGSHFHDWIDRPSDRVRKKFFGKIKWTKVTIMQKRRQVMQKFLKLIKPRINSLACLTDKR